MRLADRNCVRGPNFSAEPKCAPISIDALPTTLRGVMLDVDSRRYILNSGFYVMQNKPQAGGP